MFKTAALFLMLRFYFYQKRYEGKQFIFVSVILILSDTAKSLINIRGQFNE